VKFVVSGARQETGESVTLSIDAATAASAERQAQDLGVLVSSVRRKSRFRLGVPKIGRKLGLEQIQAQIDRRHPPDHCWHCGYSTTGWPTPICPECGNGPRPAPPPPPALASAEHYLLRITIASEYIAKMLRVAVWILAIWIGLLLIGLILELMTYLIQDPY